MSEVKKPAICDTTSIHDTELGYEYMLKLQYIHLAIIAGL